MATEAQDFVAKHNYEQGTYENKLASQGYNVGELLATNKYGRNINPGEYQQIIGSIQSPLQQQRDQAQQQLQNIASQQYAFDPQQFLPGIQEQARGVFAPQQAQLEAIRQLQSSQYQEQKITTEEQFTKQLQGEIESINNRGAYFGGGAIEREQEIGDLKLRALNQLGMQAQASDFSNLAQQGILASDESQFIQDRLFNAESGAYARWSDQRNFSYQAALQQYQVYQDERNFARDVFESDRTFDQNSELMDMKQKEFEQTYNITSKEFEMAKEQFNVDMKQKNLSYENAMDNFKNKYATDNSGVLGLDKQGNDIEQGYYDSYQTQYEGVSSQYGQDLFEDKGSSYDGGTFDIDSYLSNNLSQ